MAYQLTGGKSIDLSYISQGCKASMRTSDTSFSPIFFICQANRSQLQTPGCEPKGRTANSSERKAVRPMGSLLAEEAAAQNHF